MAIQPARYPKPLKKGDTIGIISPGSAEKKPERMHKATQILEQQGYKIVIDSQNYSQSGQLAGSDRERADALIKMFADPSIDAIMCARGGNGSIRLLEILDYDLIARNPKLFVGYSDITVLHHALRNRCGFVTYQGPMLVSFGSDYDPKTLHDFINVLSHAGGSVSLEFPEVETLRPGTAEGTIVAGNMTMLQNILATPYGWTGEGAILVIEDVDEVLYRIDRMLRHFYLAGKLKNVAAVLVGEMIDVPDGETAFMRDGERPYGHTIKQIFQDLLPNVPLGINAPCGHGRYMTTLPVGGHARVTLDKAGAKLEILGN